MEPYYNYADGAVLPFGDGSIQIQRIRNRDDKHIRVYRRQDESGRNFLCMASGIENNPESYRMAAVGWLREYARVRLGEQVRYYGAQMHVTVGRIAIKEQKTRWGSCSSKGNLNFNWKLILMPQRIQDYVVVHELAHRKQMNHSAAFWKEVEKVLPDYMECRQWLREHEAEYTRF